MPYKDPKKQRAAQHRHYLENKVVYRDRSRARRASLRKWFNEEVLSKLKCEKCPEKHPACLDFHHRNPSDGDVHVSDLVGSLRSKEWILSEIKKCLVLCANCHRKLHWRLRRTSNGV